MAASKSWILCYRLVYLKLLQLESFLFRTIETYAAALQTKQIKAEKYNEFEKNVLIPDFFTAERGDDSVGPVWDREISHFA